MRPSRTGWLRRSPSGTSLVLRKFPKSINHQNLELSFTLLQIQTEFVNGGRQNGRIGIRVSGTGYETPKLPRLTC